MTDVVNIASAHRCHICERPREHEDEQYLVALRNGLYLPACFRCWFMWPDVHKVWPAEGYGRPLEEDAARDQHRMLSLDELVHLLGDTA